MKNKFILKKVSKRQYIVIDKCLINGRLVSPISLSEVKKLIGKAEEEEKTEWELEFVEGKLKLV